MKKHRYKFTGPAGEVEIKDPHTWYAAVAVLAIMIVLFILHHSLGWEPWFVAAIGLTLLVAWVACFSCLLSAACRSA